MKILRLTLQTIAAFVLVALLKPFLDAPSSGGLILFGLSIAGSRNIDAPQYPTAAQTGAVTRQIALPRESLLKALYVRFAATFSVTGGSGAGTIYADATYRWFKRIAINTSRRKLWDVSGQALSLFNKFWQNGREIQDPPSNDTAALSESVEANLHLPFYMPYSDNPGMLALPLYALENPSIEIEIDKASAAVNGEDATSIQFTNGVLSLYEEPILNQRKTPARRYYGLPMYNQLEYAFTTSESAHKFYLENIEPGEEIRAILIEAFDTGTAGGEDYEYSDAVADEIVVNINGEEKIQKTPWTVYQDRNVRHYGLSAREVGVVLVDFGEDKTVGPGNLWMVRGGPKPYVQLKLTFGTTSSKIRITTFTCLRANPRAA